MTPTSTLALAPGLGLVTRRPTALLFATAGDGALVNAFDTSAIGGELQALASATVAAGFTVGPFVAVSWSGDVRVMAYGDVAIETDQPSLPMLSGAGSRTWVEHTLAPADGPIVVEVAAGSTEAATDLVAGTVLAGGFRLVLGGELVVDRSAPRSEPATSAEPPSHPTRSRRQRRHVTRREPSR